MAEPLPGISCMGQRHTAIVTRNESSAPANIWQSLALGLETSAAMLRRVTR
jgi:hypothetical protein